MERVDLFEIKTMYRDNFRVSGFRFGAGDPALCVVGSMRGNENQQLYCCMGLIRRLQALEAAGKLCPGREILVIPCVNPYSMNVKKRIWTVDNTDINRMFPGYELGETTQRIAAGVFEKIQNFGIGIQFASFYMPGSFVPHVRVMKTGYENVDMARAFGLPYVVVHEPRPFDTATLNYNWQIWGANAFSIYTTNTARLDKESARQSVEGILRLMANQGLMDLELPPCPAARVVSTRDMVSVRVRDSGFFEGEVRAGQHVERGQRLAEVVDPYTGAVRCTLTAPVSGIVAFMHDEPMTYENTAVFKLFPDGH